MTTDLPRVDLSYRPARVIALLGLAATALLMITEAQLLWDGPAPVLLTGVAASAVLWLLMSANVVHRMRARRLAFELKSLGNDGEAASPSSAADMPHVASSAGHKHVTTWVTLPLGIVTTAMIWEPATSPWPGHTELLWIGATVTIVTWLLVVANAVNRTEATGLAVRCKSMRKLDELKLAVLEPSKPKGPSTIDLAYVPAWLILLLGLVATAMLWHAETHIWNTRTPLLLVGAAVSAVVWLMVVANALNRARARKLDEELGSLRESEALALGTLESLEVLISACLPDGSRTRFNSRYLDFTGKTKQELAERGWLECVHPDDRQQCLDTIVTQAGRAGEERQIEYCMLGGDGEHRWVREFLVPRYDGNGMLLEYIATAVDITAQVQNDTKQDEAMGRLREDASRMKSEVSKLTRSGDRLQSKAEEAQAAARQAGQRLATARSHLAEAKADLKTAQAELQRTKAENNRLAKSCRKLQDVASSLEAKEQDLHDQIAQDANQHEKAEADLKAALVEQQRTKAEHSRLNKSFDKLQDVISSLESNEQDLRDQIARNLKQHERAKEAASEARQKASQHRAKSNRLTIRCKELEDELADVQAKHAEALTAAADLTAQARQAKEAAGRAESSAKSAAGKVEAGLAKEIRTQLNGVMNMTQLLAESALDETQRNQLENAQASAEAMATLIDQALGRTSHSQANKPKIRSFDLGAAANGVRDLLLDSARQRGVTISCAVDGDVPSPVSGDPVQLREVLMYLVNSAIRLVDDGEVRLRISQEGSTVTHVTTQFEISHGSARVAADEMEAMFSMKTLPSDIKPGEAVPSQYQAAVAWKLISQMHGEFAFELPDQGGFRIWFTITLAKQAVRQDSPQPARTARPSKPRLPQEMLKCNFGEVVELGAEEMRVNCTKDLKGTVKVELLELDQPLKLQAEVAWSKRLGPRRFDVGLRFINVTPQQSRQIMEVAMEHRRRMVLPVD
ncbi:MAG: PAS domain-containing protein [Planctomycetes bacterium]|nr:PAS domain-containing protein [Planctomycetota bacterium]